MNYKISSLLVAALFLISVSASVGAQSQTRQAYWHNSDYYSIQLNGIGNAFVSAEMNLQSLSAMSVHRITLRIPYANVQIYRVLNTNSSPCPYYGNAYPYPCYSGYNLEFANYTTIQGPNYTMLTLFLRQPLANNSQTTLYLFFSTTGTARGTFQGYQFAFNTIVDENALIKEAYAGVEVPQNMYLKGQPSFNINYQSETLQTAVVGAAAPAQIATYLPGIFRGSYQYHASNLLPGEDFTVSGLFGSNLILLYLPEIISVAMVLAVLAFVIKRSIKRSMLSRLRAVFSIKTKKEFSLTRPLLVGGVSGFTFEIAWYAVQALYSLMGYYYYNSPLSILLGLLSVVALAISLFGLPYYLYAKFSKKEGVLAGIVAIVAALVYSIIILYIFYAPPVVYPVTAG